MEMNVEKEFIEKFNELIPGNQKHIMAILEELSFAQSCCTAETDNLQKNKAL
ncbi:MAG: hypothetical protein LUC98_14245 [Lachnospiraceae bacterium]|nr:hypothetical protein [Lachnospiraceae bacterium]